MVTCTLYHLGSHAVEGVYALLGGLAIINIKTNEGVQIIIENKMIKRNVLMAYHIREGVVCGVNSPFLIEATARLQKKLA